MKGVWASDPDISVPVGDAYTVFQPTEPSLINVTEVSYAFEGGNNSTSPVVELRCRWMKASAPKVGYVYRPKLAKGIAPNSVMLVVSVYAEGKGVFVLRAWVLSAKGTTLALNTFGRTDESWSRPWEKES